MAALSSVTREFLRRFEQIPVHGLGLSVDIYSPHLTSLLRVLQQRQVLPAYLEVFRATPSALASVRNRLGNGLLTYHGEGLWLTQPESADDPLFRQEVREVAGHLELLQSAWLNHECATKYIAGYSHGTYLPPLYTESSAEVVADNTTLVQNLLDRHCRLANGGTPLVLLEMSPLTYFVVGTLPIPTFFRLVTEKVPCGLVLDVGHLWTVFRYTGAWRTASAAQYVDAFLREFPLERVVEIHVAGLALHESRLAVPSEEMETRMDDSLPAWTDAHAAPIPPVLFEMLDQILNHPRLTGLKGLALEVDTKPEELIVDEFIRFSQRYADVFPRGEPRGFSLLRRRSFSYEGRAAVVPLVPSAERAEACPPSPRLGRTPARILPQRNSRGFLRRRVKRDTRVSYDKGDTSVRREPVSTSIRQALGEAYDRYALLVTGRAKREGPEWIPPSTCTEELATYWSVYLPYEILHWGGDVEAMFPESCRRLDERGVPLSRFVAFWFRQPRPLAGTYDFFLFKTARFFEFVCEEAPELGGIAEQEADQLRRAYHFANEPAVSAPGDKI